VAEKEPGIRTEPGFEDAWPGASALATECVLNLGFLNQQMEAFGQSVVRRRGIPSVAAFNVLTILHGAGESLPPSAIAERMIVSRPTMTGILGTLERRGLIRRLPHGKDRRMTLVEITAEGRSRVDQLLPELHQAEKRWIGCLTEGEQLSLLGMLAKLQANA
jgi:DNA-binding MarR family transcriptional regulator